MTYGRQALMTPEPMFANESFFLRNHYHCYLHAKAKIVAFEFKAFKWES